MSTPALLRLENRRQQGVELPHHLTRGKATGFDGVECIQQTSGMVLQSGRLMNGGVEFTARLRCDIHCRIGVTVRDFTEGGDDRGTVPIVLRLCYDLEYETDLLSLTGEVDFPSNNPNAMVDMVFEILDDLQNKEGKTIIMVEQNAKKGLEFADIGYVLVSGQLAIAGAGDELLANPKVGELFLGG